MRNVRRVGAIVVAAMFAGTLAFALAPLGTIGLYGVAGLIGLGIVAFIVREEVSPHLADAVQRVSPARYADGARARSSCAGRALVAISVPVAAGVLGWGFAQAGMKAAIALVALVVGAVGLWLAYPLVRDLMQTPPEDVPERSRTSTSTSATVAAVPRPVRLLGTTCVVVGAGLLAWASAQLGLKGFLALGGAVVAGALLAKVRDRSVFFTFAGVSSLAFVLHKSFSAQDLVQSGGAISIYITTFDAVLLLLYGIWISEGTFAADVRFALRQRRVLLVPLIGALFLVPSLIAAPSLLHSASELFRMAWMYLLFFYMAVRVRTRRHVWAVLGGLGVLAAIELVVVVLQWKTGGVLGLSFLGVPKELGERVTDTSVLGRPFGTIIHPVFMGAVLGVLALLALGIGLTLRRSLTKVVALAFVPVCLVPLYLAHTRAALVAVGIVALVVVGAALARGALQWSTVGKAIVIALIGAAVFWPQLADKFDENFSTGHFTEEIDSRRELNDIAGQMIEDHPAVGVGLNNFELVMGPYERHGIIFFNNPVHNVYLLYLAETGVIGFAGVVLVGVAMYNVSIRLARSRDPLYAGVGLGVAAGMGFLMVEELLGFSLRQDIPLALYWLLAGLALACTTMAGPLKRDRRAPKQRQRPERPSEQERRARAIERDLPQLVDTYRQTHAVSAIGLDELTHMDLAWVRKQTPEVRLRTHGGWRVRRFAFGGLCIGAMLAVLPFAAPSFASSTDHLRIVFSATDRKTGIEGIYTAEADGSGQRRLTPGDGRFYNWPQWAFGGTHIVYTVRSGAEGEPEDLYLMNADGSGQRLVQHFEYRIAQPKVSPDGRSVVFTAQAPWFPHVAVYKLDLETLEAVNLSAVTSPTGAVDADPMLYAGGDRIALAASDLVHTQINTMRTDGSDRRRVTADGYFNTDPDVSPDGSAVAIASYRGEGSPGEPGKLSILGVKPRDWHLVVRDMNTGSERVLTEGKECVTRMPGSPCRPDETAAFKPRWTPDGKEIGFNGTLDIAHSCICVIGADGRNARSLISSEQLSLDWFDWIVPDPASANPPGIGSKQRGSRLLVTQAAADGIPRLLNTSADLMHRESVDLPVGLRPDGARWTPDHRHIVFSAETSVPAVPSAPHPAAPTGQSRRAHVTLDELSGVSLARQQAAATDSGDGPAIPKQQVFLREADGSVRQLTDPWIEDYRDGVASGDARGNTDPAISPDGRYVVFTNTSSRTRESFLLRLDLQTGEVLNLTNGTAGAVPVDDAKPQFSADGSRLTFTWTKGSSSDVFVMDVAGGTAVAPVTDDDYPDTSPTFSPDGGSIVYASYRSSEPIARTDASGRAVLNTKGWVLVRVDVATGQQTVLTRAEDSPTWQPVVAPEGDRVLYVGVGGRSVDLFAVPLAGTDVPRLLQPDPNDNELKVDWR